MTNIDHNTTTVTTSAHMMTPGVETITADLLAAIRKHTKNAGENWNASSTLEDVGVDSFDLVELIFDIEDRYGITINFNANRTAVDFSTVADVARVIAEELGKQGRAA